MRVYKLNADAAAGTTSSIATLDIVEDGKIKAIAWAGTALNMDALGDEYRAEVSFSSSNTMDQNDVRQSISEVGCAQNFLTSGGGGGSLNHSVTGLDLNVVAGERIHLHSKLSTGVSGRISCHIYVKDGSGGRTRNRRSR